MKKNSPVKIIKDNRRYLINLIRDDVRYLPEAGGFSLDMQTEIKKKINSLISALKKL